jgi:hypothetical protein
MGPAPFSTLGMRIQNEQSGSSSLFAQPMAIEAIPDTTEIRDQGSGVSTSPAAESEAGSVATSETGVAAPARLPRGLLEARMETALAALTEPTQSPSATIRQGHLALLKRWYYRPEVRRSGEIFFPDPEGRWPTKSMLRGVGRVGAKMLIPAHRA